MRTLKGLEMTRFLPHIFADLAYGGFNEEMDRLFAYQHATKHAHQSVWANAHCVDWHNQLDQFPVYEDSRKILLPPEPGLL
jgi:hypothetical protein